MKTKITEAFKDLRKLGYFARQNYKCCQTCGWAAIPEDKGEKAVFYHSQDNTQLLETGSTHLAWAGDGDEICRVLNKHDIATIWNGSDATRIEIK